jgi:hypothetical protein
MDQIQSIDRHSEARVHRIDVGRTLAVAVTIGLALVITVSLILGVAVVRGIAPEFDQSIVLPGRHQLMIHNGPSPTCIPNPLQHYCFRPGQARREFSVVYLTPHGVRSLVWFRLPPR